MKPTTAEPQDKNIKYWALFTFLIVAILGFLAIQNIAHEDYLSKLTPEERQNIIDREQAEIEKRKQDQQGFFDSFFQPIEIPAFIIVGGIFIMIYLFISRRVY